MERVKKNVIKQQGFTLIELLAVIIILGILMIIAVPSVTSYINNSRKSAYIKTAKSIITGTSILVNSGGFDFNDTDTTYYIEGEYIKTNNNIYESPYGKFSNAYVIVTTDEYNHNYYWTSVDETGTGVKNIVLQSALSENDIVDNIPLDSIQPNIGIGERSKIVIIKSDGTSENGTVEYNVPESGGERTIIDNTLIANAICRRATELHRVSCDDFEFGCDFHDDKEWAIIYGNETTTNRVLTPGDAFDCDVNDDGIYNPENERFYYVSSSGNNASLIFYSNVANGVVNNSEGFCYGYNYDTYNPENWLGPNEASGYLPSTFSWKNPKLILPGIRQITNEIGGTTTDINGTYGGPHTIEPYDYYLNVARFLTYQEVVNACGGGDPTSHSYLMNCLFLAENTEYVDFVSRDCYWLETLASRTYDSAWMVQDGYLSTMFVDAVCGVRPVITVAKSNIAY